MRDKDSYTARQHQMVERLLRRISDFCKMNIEYDSGLSQRTINRLMEDYRLTGWHLLTAEHPGLDTLNTSDYSLRVHGVGLQGYQEISHLMRSYFIPNTPPDHATKSSWGGTRWYHGLGEFINNYVPELLDPELVDKGYQLTQEYNRFNYLKAGETEKPDTELYTEFFNLIDQKLGLTLEARPTISTICEKVFGTSEPETFQTIHAASGQAALNIYNLLQNSAHDELFKEYLDLRHKFLHEGELNKWKERKPPIRLKLWQDFTNASYGGSTILQELKANLDVLGWHYLSKNGFGFPISMCPDKPKNVRFTSRDIS